MKVPDKNASTNNSNYLLQNGDVVIDISMLYEISDNDKNFILTMVRTFLKNMPVTLQNLEQGLNNKDWEQVYKAAHSAKSSLSVLKIKQMLDLVLQIEENALNKINLDNVPALADKIKQTFFLAEQILIEKCREKDNF